MDQSHSVEDPLIQGQKKKSVAAPPSKSRSFERIATNFELTTVRCSVEAGLRDRVAQKEDLRKRIKALTEEAGDTRVQMRLGLLTDGYRVDEAITPKLHRLGSILTQILRLSHPLDMFVQPSDERNAYCLPSRKGNRLVMCLNSGLLAALSNEELLFVMGHEVGHAILKHGDIPGISFDHPEFSPMEVIQLRALDRAQEISCDRVGLLACQDVRVASTALFKLASGLTERWISFDEMAYARHFDELSSMAELVDMDNVSRTHPLIPLRVKALIAYSRSDTYATAFGRRSGSLSIQEVERSVETMLSVLLPDLTELENAQEEEALQQFLFDGALLVIAADGIVEPGEVAWLESFSEQKWTTAELAERLASEEFQTELRARVAGSAHILRNKLPEQKRAGLLHVLCEVALSAGGIPDDEFEILNHLRELLDIRVELAQSVLHHAREDNQEHGSVSLEDGDSKTSGGDTQSADPLEMVLVDAKLPEKQLVHAREICETIRARHTSPGEAIRALVSWAITAAKRGGPLTTSQGKRIGISAVKRFRAIQEEAGVYQRRGGTPTDRRIRESGVVALFQRGEKVERTSDSRSYLVVSISRTKGRIRIAPEDNMEAIEETTPDELTKDPVAGLWPPELSE